MLALKRQVTRSWVFWQYANSSVQALGKAAGLGHAAGKIYVR